MVTTLRRHKSWTFRCGAAILGVEPIVERSVVRNGEIAIRATGNVSLTFDDRVVDGARAAAVTLAAVIHHLQET